MPVTVVQGTLKKGDVIGGRYQILRKLGTGGCGSVYQCRDQKKDTDVAVKVLENPNDAARFTREAKVMKGLQHPHVVELYATGKHQKSLPFIVLEYLEGRGLRQFLSKSKRLTPELSAWLMLMTVRGLRAVKTVHRDLKPENLLIQLPEGARSVRFIPGDAVNAASVKVADFGLAKPTDMRETSLTRSGQIMGTPQYMSPEQCRNTKHVSFKTDIYAIGILLVELNTGRVPFDANNVYDLMAKHCNDEPKLASVAKSLRPIAERCLAKKPGERYRSLKALEDELSAVAGVSSSGSSRGCVVVIVVTVLVVALGAAAAWWYRSEISNWWEQFQSQ